MATKTILIEINGKYCPSTIEVADEPIIELTEEEKRAKYEDLCEIYIRQKYSVSDELGIQRRKDIEPDKYRVYFDYVEECLTNAHKEIYGW